MTPATKTRCEICLVGREGANLGRFAPPADFDTARPPPVLCYNGMIFVHRRPLPALPGHEYRQVRPLQLTTMARLT